jgi:hypothetical protein
MDSLGTKIAYGIQHLNNELALMAILRSPAQQIRQHCLIAHVHQGPLLQERQSSVPGQAD